MVPALTPGLSSKLNGMLADAIELLANRKKFVVRVTARGKTVMVAANDSGALVALALRRQREKHGLSLADVSARLGATSRNAYARYEQGRSVPTIEKLGELFHPVAPEAPLILRVA